MDIIMGKNSKEIARTRKRNIASAAISDTVYSVAISGVSWGLSIFLYALLPGSNQTKITDIIKPECVDFVIPVISIYALLTYLTNSYFGRKSATNTLHILCVQAVYLVILFAANYFYSPHSVRFLAIVELYFIVITILRILSKNMITEIYRKLSNKNALKNINEKQGLTGFLVCVFMVLISAGALMLILDRTVIAEEIANSAYFVILFAILIEIVSMAAVGHKGRLIGKNEK